MELDAESIIIRISIDPIDIVFHIKGMTLPGPAILRAPIIEQHHGHVNTAPTGARHPFAKPRKKGIIELRKIELRFSVERIIRPYPLPWKWLDYGVARLVPSVFQDPHTGEVVIVLLKPDEIAFESFSQRFDVIGIDVLQAIPCMRTRQVNRFTRIISKVSRIDVTDP
jgi:hypothetical protein